ncbi:hypothetical protein BHM03_00007966 [Ensete ventricosum]|nr:hypothetical protein BHM03_00007966 [Ensete ventricosum]
MQRPPRSGRPGLSCHPDVQHARARSRCTPSDGLDAASAWDVDLAKRGGFDEIYLRHADPSIGVDLYTLPFEVLMERAAKAIVLLVESCGRLDDSESQLRNATTQVRQMEIELLELTQAKDALWVDLPRQTIKDYKKSPRFEMGLVRMGRVSLEYRYQLVLARLQAQHSKLEIEEDPFALLPKDVGMSMADEQPFDDSFLPPEE